MTKWNLVRSPALWLSAGNALLLILIAFRLIPGGAYTTAHAASQESPALAPVLRARALELVDEDGRVRSRFNVEANGDVVLRMMDQSGTIRVKVGANANGAALLLIDEQTEPAVHMVARREAGPEGRTTTSLTLRGANGRLNVMRP